MTSADADRLLLRGPGRNPVGEPVIGCARPKEATRGRRLSIRTGPTVEEAEFDSLVSTMRDWSGGLGATARRAFGEKLRRSRGTDDGIPATALHAGLPADLLVTYLRRSCDYVAVIGTGSRGRRVMAKRDIG